MEKEGCPHGVQDECSDYADYRLDEGKCIRTARMRPSHPSVSGPIIVLAQRFVCFLDSRQEGQLEIRNICRKTRPK